MAEECVSVRLAAVGGRQVKAELEGAGEAGKRGFSNSRWSAYALAIRSTSQDRITDLARP